MYSTLQYSGRWHTNNGLVEVPVKVEVEGNHVEHVSCLMFSPSLSSVYFFFFCCVLCRSISGLAVLLDYDVTVVVDSEDTVVCSEDTSRW